MKKRIFTLALALALVMSLSVPVLAAPITTQTSQGSTLTYEVAQTFSVTIPESSITVSKVDNYRNLGLPVTVSAGMLIDNGKVLTVKLYSANVADGSFHLVNASDAATKVAYSLKIGANEDNVTPGADAQTAATILTVY